MRGSTQWTKCSGEQNGTLEKTKDSLSIYFTYDYVRFLETIASGLLLLNIVPSQRNQVRGLHLLAPANLLAFDFRQGIISGGLQGFHLDTKTNKKERARRKRYPKEGDEGGSSC